MRLAIAGKGGVGKTTVAASLARSYRRAGASVLAIDADPNSCLGAALGVPADIMARVQPLSDLRDVLAERAGGKPGAGGLYILNPPVDDLIAQHAIEHEGIRLMVMGTVTQGGGGCVCPENTTLRAVLRRLVDEPNDVILLDMEAGVEHLGRATAQNVDLMLVVVEPTLASMATVHRIVRLGADIGLNNVGIVGNKIVSEAHGDLVTREAGDIPVLGMLPRDPAILDAAMGSHAVPVAGAYAEAVEQLREAISEAAGA
jgi:CO dehydrogenase maturation factor